MLRWSARIVISMDSLPVLLQFVFLAMRSQHHTQVNLVQIVLPATAQTHGLPPHSMDNTLFHSITERKAPSLVPRAIRVVIKFILVMAVMNTPNRILFRSIGRKASLNSRTASNVTQMAASTKAAINIKDRS